MENLIQVYRKLLSETSTDFVRYLYDEIPWESRFVAITGCRGVGKTTMMLQHILLSGRQDSSLYISADDTYFSNHSLYDVASDFYKMGGRFLYIDEVHKYHDWSREVKNMYDALKGLQVVVSGSSMLAIRRKIDADLSRRMLVYTLEGLSLREYLNFRYGTSIKPYSLEEILSGKATLPSQLGQPLPLFKEYLECGYFPFFGEKGIRQRLMGIITATLEEDISNYAELTPLQVRKLKHLLHAIATSVPYKPNFSDLGRQIGADRKLIPAFLDYMEKAGLIRQLHAKGEGNLYLDKPEKIYLANCCFINAMTEQSSNVGNVRETAFLSMMCVRHDVRYAGNTDFYIDGHYFEVGGKNKGGSQIAGLDNAYIVKDDIEYSALRQIPLWAFGLNY